MQSRSGSLKIETQFNLQKCAQLSDPFKSAQLIAVIVAVLLRPDLFVSRDLSLLHRFMVSSLTLLGRGVPLESSGVRVYTREAVTILMRQPSSLR
jgi:hypothetical protein